MNEDRYYADNHFDSMENFTQLFMENGRLNLYPNDPREIYSYESGFWNSNPCIKGTIYNHETIIPFQAFFSFDKKRNIKIKFPVQIIEQLVSGQNKFIETATTCQADAIVKTVYSYVRGGGFSQDVIRWLTTLENDIESFKRFKKNNYNNLLDEREERADRLRLILKEIPNIIKDMEREKFCKQSKSMISKTLNLIIKVPYPAAVLGTPTLNDEEREVSSLINDFLKGVNAHKDLERIQEVKQQLKNTKYYKNRQTVLSNVFIKLENNLKNIETTITKDYKEILQFWDDIIKNSHNLTDDVKKTIQVNLEQIKLIQNNDPNPGCMYFIKLTKLLSLIKNDESYIFFKEILYQKDIIDSIVNRIFTTLLASKDCPNMAKYSQMVTAEEEENSDIGVIDQLLWGDIFMSGFGDNTIKGNLTGDSLATQDLYSNEYLMRKNDNGNQNNVLTGSLGWFLCGLRETIGHRAFKQLIAGETFLKCLETYDRNSDIPIQEHIVKALFILEKKSEFKAMSLFDNTNADDRKLIENMRDNIKSYVSIASSYITGREMPHYDIFSVLSLLNYGAGVVPFDKSGYLSIGPFDNKRYQGQSQVSNESQDTQSLHNPDDKLTGIENIKNIKSLGLFVLDNNPQGNKIDNDLSEQFKKAHKALKGQMIRECNNKKYEFFGEKLIKEGQKFNYTIALPQYIILQNAVMVETLAKELKLTDNEKKELSYAIEYMKHIAINEGLEIKELCMLYKDYQSGVLNVQHIDRNKLHHLKVLLGMLRINAMSTDPVLKNHTIDDKAKFWMYCFLQSEAKKSGIKIDAYANDLSLLRLNGEYIKKIRCSI